MPTVSLPAGLLSHATDAASGAVSLARMRRRRRHSAVIAAALVRRSVSALTAGRHTCRHCARTPLVGERVYLYRAGQDREEVVCELCRPLRLAEPDRSLLMRSPEQAGAVRVRAMPRPT